MRRAALGFAVALAAACPALAEEAAVIAALAERSGTVPPDYAWSSSVAFRSDGTVAARYCKGYADAAPGCAEGRAALASADLAALQAALAPLMADLAAHPVLEATEVPIGGGTISGRLVLGGQDLPLPAFPVDADKARVAAALGVLQAFIPAGLLDDAAAQAKAP